MRTNATIQFSLGSGVDYDENGIPITTEGEWSEPIDCNAKAISDTRRGRYEDGVFRQSSYSVLLEGKYLTRERYTAQAALLTIGEQQPRRFDIQNIEDTPSMGRAVITL